ncbi:MAG: low molecular weight phosphotyrosine protein phosphatase [Rubrivivax sp.]|nr:low molecular weight phosphotyrosine protein phosphatase [Rubrivivax sp.]
MVCTGNICRSPTAEGVLRAKLAAAGLQAQVGVASAGTQGYHTGEAPDPRAIRAALQRGYDIAGLQARPVRAEDFTRFHWLLALDRSHRDWMVKHAPPTAGGRIGLLMPLATRYASVEEVPDPYYGAPAGFEHVLDLLEDACDGLVRRVTKGEPLTGELRPG